MYTSHTTHAGWSGSILHAWTNMLMTGSSLPLVISRSLQLWPDSWCAKNNQACRWIWRKPLQLEGLELDLILICNYPNAVKSRPEDLILFNRWSHMPCKNLSWENGWTGWHNHFDCVLRFLEALAKSESFDFWTFLLSDTQVIAPTVWQYGLGVG